MRISRAAATSGVIDLNDGGAMRMEGHTGAVFALCVVGGWVVSGSLDRRLGVWDGRSGRLVRFLEGHSNTVCCLHPLHLPAAHRRPARTVLLSGSLDRTVAVWNAPADRDPGDWGAGGVFGGHRDCVNCVASWGGRALSGSSDGTIALWRPPAGRADAAEAVLDAGLEVVRRAAPRARARTGRRRVTGGLWGRPGRCTRWR